MEAENGDPLEEEMPFGGKLHQFQDSQGFFSGFQINTIRTIRACPPSCNAA